MKTVLILFLTSVLYYSAGAQKMSWRDYSDIADKSYKAQDYGAAAKNYKQAWQKKKSHNDLLYKAGESYYLVKNYKEAANAYSKLLKNTKQFADVSFKYARALKQDGQFELAKAEFEKFIANYKAEDKPQIAEAVKREIEGCNLALQNAVNTNITISYPGTVINSSYQDFAPVPFTENVLYFSSTRKGKAKIYRSEFEGGVWSKPTIPDIFPKDETGHIANGSFSEDYKRFYYTICREVETSKGKESKCNIYVAINQNGKWSEPLKMRPYINDTAYTNTQPFVVQSNGKEIMYFSSNRPGGLGGSDIWYTERELNTDDLDFTVPRNCGPQINSQGDEKTPWYDVSTSSLYFSSNGWPSIGGFDIFKSRGQAKTWEANVNLGQPLNSSADEMYYIKKPGSSSGYFASNRTWPAYKNTTENEDIFSFESNAGENIISGNITEATQNKPLADVRITVYEVFPDGRDNMFDTKIWPQGKYSFSLPPNKKYKLKAELFEYNNQFYRFETIENAGNKISYDIVMTKDTSSILKASDLAVKENPKDVKTKTKPPQAKPVTPKPAPTKEKPETVTPPKENVLINPTSPTSMIDKRTRTFIKEGQYFLIQLAAARNPQVESPQFLKAKSLGSLEREPVDNKDMERVLLAWWATRKEAFDALAKVKRIGFKTAFVTRHEDGYRKAILR